MTRPHRLLQRQRKDNRGVDLLERIQPRLRVLVHTKILEGVQNIDN